MVDIGKDQRMGTRRWLTPKARLTYTKEWVDMLSQPQQPGWRRAHKHAFFTWLTWTIYFWVYRVSCIYIYFHFDNGIFFHKKADYFAIAVKLTNYMVAQFVYLHPRGWESHSQQGFPFGIVKFRVGVNCNPRNPPSLPSSLGGRDTIHPSIHPSFKCSDWKPHNIPYLLIGTCTTTFKVAT